MALVFILAGQSNAVGSGVAAELPAELRTIPANVEFFLGDSPGELAGREHFGPEVGAVHALAAARPNEQLVLLKVASSGANLFSDWNPDGVSTGPEDVYRGPMYPRLLTAWDKVRDHLAGQGGTAVAAGLLWVQGERDSVYDFMAAAYEDNFTAFIAALRRDLEAPALGVAAARVNPQQIDQETGTFRHAHKELVRQAFRTVGAAAEGVVCVETDDLPQGDALHYDTHGQLELGRRLALAALPA